MVGAGRDGAHWNLTDSLIHPHCQLHQCSWSNKKLRLRLICNDTDHHSQFSPGSMRMRRMTRTVPRSPSLASISDFNWLLSFNINIRNLLQIRVLGSGIKEGILGSINPIRSGGGLNQPALFSDGYFSMKKGVWRPQISWLFLIHYELSEKQIMFFLVFHSVLGWSTRCRLIQSPPHSSNIQEPRPIRVKNIGSIEITVPSVVRHIDAVFLSIFGWLLILVSHSSVVFHWNFLSRNSRFNPFLRFD